MKSVSHSKSFDMDVPIDALFPLFSPEGERYWVPDWEYTNVMGTTEMREDDVFLTEAHDHGSTKAIWLVKRYEPKLYLVQFYKVEPNDKVGIITVKCSVRQRGSTTVEVTYKYIALSNTGERFIADFDDRAYDLFIGEWHELLSRYFSERREGV